MIILKFNLAHHGTLHSESQAMIARYYQAPHSFAISLERVKSPTWNRFELGNIFSLLNCSQHCSKLCLVLPRNSARFITQP